MPKFLAFMAIFALLQGCANVTTFPSLARGGETVALMIGGSEQARKETVDVTLTDAGGGQWDLQALGRVRAVFSVRTDGRAEGLHYNPYVDAVFPWAAGPHEPLQTVLVLDLPQGIPTGMATIDINTHTDDNAVGFSEPISINLEVVPGSGSPDTLARQAAPNAIPTDFSRLEPAPHAKIYFPGEWTKIGALSMTIDYDESILNGDDIDLYVPQSYVRNTGEAFGADTQRMVSWRQDGSQLNITAVSPRGIAASYLQFFVIHPRGITTPGFAITRIDIYDINGEAMTSLAPKLEYFP